MQNPKNILELRKTGYPVDAQFLQRWSPRSMSGGHLNRSTLMTLLEAARWAPSSGNSQPWRFVFGLRPTSGFNNLLEVLNPGNRVWCAQAGALILITSQTWMERKGQRMPLPTHAFDAGAAWMSLALQGSSMNLVVHAMAGFDPVKAREVVSLPEGIEPQAMIAVGFPAPLDQLPESLRDREKPSERKPVSEFAFEERWPEV